MGLFGKRGSGSQFSVHRCQWSGNRGTTDGNVSRGTYSFCLVYLYVSPIINSKVLKINLRLGINGQVLKDTGGQVEVETCQIVSILEN
jgi:hypothetical protein